MVKGLYTAATGMINEQRRVDVLANNLANSSTTGFKAEGSTSESFYDVLAYKIKDTSEPFEARKLGAMNLGVKIGETYTDYSEGSFVTTNNDYDMALSGKGFFAIEFTSKGDYVLDINGQHIILDPLVKPTMGLDGTIYQNGNAVAKIQVQDFEDYNYLKKYGETYYDAIEGATLIESTATIYNGMLEASNVQTVKEMVNLINYQRAYDTNQKMIQAHNETLDVAVNQVGKV